MIQGDSEKYLFIIKKDLPLVATLTQYLYEHKLQGGMISGLGALKNVELGYYDLHQQTYIRKTFDQDDYELLNLTGNYAFKEHQPLVHVHATLGARDFSTFGGHLFEATVAVTAEVSVTPLGKMPCRQFDQQTGLFLICGIHQN